MAIQIQLRRGDAADWTSTNPTLAEGEVGVEIDTLKLKVGNGTDNWNTLPYFGSAGTVTSVGALTLGTSGTDLSSTVANGTTTPVITLNVPTASASNRGVLSSADWTTFNNKGNGTVTSVTGTSPVNSSGGATPAISLASGYGDTLNPYASKTANYVLASPNGSSGVPTFRAIVASDIPTLNQNTTGTAANITATSNSTLTTLSALSLPYSQLSGTVPTWNQNTTGTASNVTGTVAIANGGSGTTTAQGAMNAFAGAVTSGSYLRGNGTNVVMSTIQTADVPTLNQNTTGSAATLATGRTISITGDLAYTSPSFNGSTNVTASGTLATVNTNVGSFTNASLTVNAKGLITAASSGTAPVTSVTGTSPVTSSGGTTPAISLASGYGDTQNPYASKTANFVLAAPNGASGVPTFRAVVASDIPTLNQNTTGTAANVTGIVAVANGGTGTATPSLVAGTNITITGSFPNQTINASGGGGSGTVTSVAATVPSFLSVSGSPITTSGTLAFSLASTPTNGQLLIGNGTGFSYSTLTAGSNITITNSSGGITIASTGGGGGLTGFTAAESTTAPNATVYVDSLTSSATSTNADVAFVAKGAGATLAQVPTSTTAGGNKRGTYATDWQKSRTAATEVASGNYSVITGGHRNTVSGQYSFIGGGEANTVSNFYSVVAGGFDCVASGNNAAVLGGETNLANADYSVSLGGFGGSTRSIVGNFVCSPSGAPITSLIGKNQLATLVIARQTTNATATRLASNSSAASTTNQVILPNNSAYYFRGEVIAGVTGAGDTKGWYVEGVIKRGANAASTALVGTPSATSLYADTGAATWSIAVTADTTNGGLAITVTGAAATTIRWVAQIRTTEMTF